MTHQERATRRQTIAKKIESGSWTVAEAAREARMSVTSILNACREYNVSTKTDKPPRPKNTYLKILKELFGRKSLRQIALECGVVPQYVSQINRDALEIGIPGIIARKFAKLRKITSEKS